MFCKEIVKKNAAEAGVLEEINITFVLGDFFFRFGCSIVNIGTLVLTCFVCLNYEHNPKLRMSYSHIDCRA